MGGSQDQVALEVGVFEYQVLGDLRDTEMPSQVIRRGAEENSLKALRSIFLLNWL